MNRKLSIGRDLHCDIVLPVTCEMASRNHAVIILEENRILFQDYSTNGTIINGTKIKNQTVEIRIGDRILIPGGYIIDWSVIRPLLSDRQTTSVNQQTMIKRPKSLFDNNPQKKDVAAINMDSIVKSSPNDRSKEKGSIFSFEGRCGRGEYWAVILILGLISSIFTTILEVNNNSGLLILFFGWVFVYLWVLFAVGSRRCHDLGHSGWFQFIPFFPICQDLFENFFAGFYNRLILI